MKTLSQTTSCHKQQRPKWRHRQQRRRQQDISGLNPIRSVGKLLMAVFTSVTTYRPNPYNSLSHLSEHQLRDIGFTRDMPENKLPYIDVGRLQAGFYEHRRNQIRPLVKHEK